MRKVRASKLKPEEPFSEALQPSSCVIATYDNGNHYSAVVEKMEETEPTGTQVCVIHCIAVHIRFCMVPA